MGVKIGDKHTDEWGLKLLQVSISMPEPKTNEEDVPGADGSLDLTEVMGPVRFGNREIQMTFDVMASPKRWYTLSSEIAGYLHGKRLRVVLDEDPGYFYMGRLSMEPAKKDYFANQLTINGNAESFKYELYSSLERWKWNDLNFFTGTIRNYRDLIVSGSRLMRILGMDQEIVPTIQASADMQVEWMGIRYPLKAGKNKIYEISIPKGENHLTFYGNGTVSIDYRGGVL